MARDEVLPFPLGGTYFGGDTTIIDATVGTHLEGKEFLVEDDIPASSGSVEVRRSNRLKKVRIVRNKNATTANAKELHKMSLAGIAGTQGVILGQIDGKTTAATDKGYPVVEQLGSAGCLTNDMCYVVVDGFAKITTDSAGDTNFAAGALIHPGAGTAGRAVEAAGALNFQAAYTLIGVAAEPINAVSTDFVVDVNGHNR